MSASHRSLRRLLLTVPCLLILGAACAPAAGAASYGELSRFGERGAETKTPVGQLAREGEEGGEKHYLLGVDAKEGDAVFTLDEPENPKTATETIAGEEVFRTTRTLRVQKWSSSGALLASRQFTTTSPATVVQEDGEQEHVEGIAVDEGSGRIYLLTVQPRQFELTKDEEAPAATTLYAFDTATATKELEAAPAANPATGVLVGPQELGAESNEKGVALLEPRGITVDPSTHEVIILGHVDDSGSHTDEISKSGDHYVLRRVSEMGKLGALYVDTSNFLKKGQEEVEAAPSSPVVTASKHVFVQFEGIAEVPYEFKSSASPSQLYLEKNFLNTTVETPSLEENSAFGGTLAVSSDGTKFYETAEIHNEALTGGSNGSSAVLERNEKGEPIGWTGGQTQVSQGEDKCAIEPTQESHPFYVGSGESGKLFVFAPAYLEKIIAGAEPKSKDAILQFGEGGSSCPGASASGVSVEENGVRLAENEPVRTGREIILSGAPGAPLGPLVKQADALVVEWTIENEATHERFTKTDKPPVFEEEKESPHRLLEQQPKLIHTFSAAGKYAVSAKITTDDLATPIVETPKRTVEVVAPPKWEVVPAGPIEIKTGGTKTITAEASGTNLKIRWEFSNDGGTSWSAVSTGVTTTPTATGDRTELKVEHAASAQQGLYRILAEEQIGSNLEKATSSSIEVLVGRERPEVLQQPANDTVAVGETATLATEASGEPTPTVQWEESTDGVHFGPVSGATSPTLTIHTSKEGKTDYRAVYTNEHGQATSTTAALTVVKEAVAPTVTVQPKTTTVVAGESATFTAEGDAVPTPTVTWQVSTNGGSTWATAAGGKTEAKVGTHGEVHTELTVSGTNAGENGSKYRATFSNTVKGTPESATSEAAELLVHQKPEITAQPAGTTVTEGQTATFSAGASGSPAPTVQWETSTNGGASWSAIGGATSTSLAVEHTNAGQSGTQYRAVFKNTLGTATSAGATLTVNAVPSPPPTQTTTTITTPEVKVEPFKESHDPIAKIAGTTSLTVSSNGAVQIKVSCPAAESKSCIGTVVLKTLTAVAASAHTAKKPKKAILTLASGSFTVAGGKTASITLHLSATARKLLAQAHVLKARATVAAHDAAGVQGTPQVSVVTLRPAPPPKKKKKH